MQVERKYILLAKSLPYILLLLKLIQCIVTEKQSNQIKNLRFNKERKAH